MGQRGARGREPGSTGAGQGCMGRGRAMHRDNEGGVDLERSGVNDVLGRCGR